MENQKIIVGIEFGSTRIKAVVIDGSHAPLASGAYDWENRWENGYWTYALEEVWAGMQGAFAQLKEDFLQKTGKKLTRIDALGISGMMHGYLPFDANGKLLAPFRTWRNTTTGPAAEQLTALFGFNVPQRWSIAHLYQAMLNGEEHVKDIAYLTTLAGYVHWQLTGKKVMGVGEASGMFPIDSKTGTYAADMVEKFDALAEKYPWKLLDILPTVLPAGEEAGILTTDGARLLDPTGELEAGTLLCPPEGDAGTGMAATNSVAPRTGNVSAGTSMFAMIVLEEMLSRVYPEIDMVTTPSGAPVAMVHCNTCTSDLNAWVGLLGEATKLLTGKDVDVNTLYGELYRAALQGDGDCGDMVAVNYFAGEPVTGVTGGRPLFVRKPESKMNIANFMRAHLNAALATLKVGMDLLLQSENVKLDTLLGHGGLFKTPVVAQKLLAGALNVPVAVMETAGEGGPWGMALLCAYMANRENGEKLEDYLQNKVFGQAKGSVLSPDPADVVGFAQYLQNYKAVLRAESAAVEAF